MDMFQPVAVTDLTQQPRPAPGQQIKRLGQGTAPGLGQMVLATFESKQRLAFHRLQLGDVAAHRLAGAVQFGDGMGQVQRFRQGRE